MTMMDRATRRASDIAEEHNLMRSALRPVAGVNKDEEREIRMHRFGLKSNNTITRGIVSVGTHPNASDAEPL